MVHTVGAVSASTCALAVDAIENARQLDLSTA